MNQKGEMSEKQSSNNEYIKAHIEYDNRGGRDHRCHIEYTMPDGVHNDYGSFKNAYIALDWIEEKYREGLSQI